MDWKSGQVTPFAFKRTGDADFPAHIKALVLGAPKSGKGLRNGTPVLGPDGWTPIEELSVGDLVQGRDGLTEVTGVFPQGERDLYRVVTDDGGSVECDDQHLWTVHPHGNSLRTEDTPTLQKKIRENQRYAHLPMPAPIERPASDLPLHPYVMGLLLGDGGFTNTTIAFHKPDPELHEVMAALLPEGAEMGSWSDPHNTLRITGLADHVRSLGLAGHASWDKFVPAPYLDGSIEQRLDLLAGLLDTDGGMNGKGVCFYTSSPQLRDGVIELVRSLGGVATVREKEDPAYAYKGEQRMGRAAYNVSIRLPGEFGCPFRLMRKVAAWGNGTTKRLPSRRITDITYIGRGESTCIKVAADDGLFVTQDHLVTHNTTFISTFPKVVVADVEAGLMSIAHKNVPYVTIDKAEKLQTLLFVLRDESMRAKVAEQMGMDEIESVAIDTMDALQELFKKERLATERRTQFEMKDWGWLLDQFRELIKAFMELPLHVALTCHTKTIQTDENKVIHQPGLQGAIAEEIAGMVSFSMLMQRTREVDSQTGQPFTAYRLQVEGDDINPHLGNRAMGRLLGTIEPTFDVLHATVYEGLKLAQQQQGEIDANLSQPDQSTQSDASDAIEQAQSQQSGATEASQQQAGSPPVEDDQPVNAAALQHVERMLGEWDFKVPVNASETWTMGFARTIARMFVATKEDLAAGKIEGGSEQARADLEEFLKSMEAWQDPGSIPNDDTVDSLMQWVGNDPERAKIALDHEKVNKNRKTAKDKLEGLIYSAPASAPAPVDTSEPPSDEPPSDSETPAQNQGQVSEVQTPVEGDDEPARDEGGAPANGASLDMQQAEELIKEELGGELVDEQNPGMPPKSELMRIESLEDAPPCEVSGDPIDDLDIAKLSLSRFGKWLCVNQYIAMTKTA